MLADDQYLEDTPMVPDQWPMWDDQHPDDRMPNNRRGGDARRMDGGGGRHGRRGPDRGRDVDRHGGLFVDDMPDDRGR